MNRALTTVFALSLVACVSEYQSARVLAPGRTSVAAAVSNVRTVGESVMEEDESLDTIDLIARQGVGAEAEVSVRYTDFSTTSTLLVGGKRSLVAERLAVALAAGPSWGGDDSGVVAIPSVLWSAPAGANAELTGAAKLVFLFDEGEREAYPGVDLGIRLSSDLQAWAFQPSLGLLRAKDTNLISLGAALSFTH